MELYSSLIGIYDGMRGGADKSVIKRETEAVGGGKICVNASALEGVAFAQSSKETVTLGLKVITSADRNDGMGVEMLCLLIIAYDDRPFLLPFGKESDARLLRASDEGQRLFGSVVAVF